MADYDNLPSDLRVWLSNAILPWGPKSVQRAYKKAQRKGHCDRRALEELDRIEQRLIAKDAPFVWGEGYP